MAEIPCQGRFLSGCTRRGCVNENPAYFCEMTAEALREYCLAFPAVTESIKWENHLCFSVGDKMFLILNPDSVPVNGSFKTSDSYFDELTQKKGIIPAPYLARHKWVHFDSLERLPDERWKYFAKLAYDLVFEKLPAGTRKKITGAKR
jgi:predicted DNA-binding protein (MmcQ/YjbR family)